MDVADVERVDVADDSDEAPVTDTTNPANVAKQGGLADNEEGDDDAPLKRGRGRLVTRIPPYPMSAEFTPG